MRQIIEKSTELLDMEIKLRELLEYAYCPYSNFRVSAIVVMRDGKHFGGVNIENAAYGSTICAERTAIYNAISNGYKEDDFISMYCMDSSDSSNISASCGSCLQVMAEFFKMDAKCIFMNCSGSMIEFTLKEMLPYSFTKQDLIDATKEIEPYTKK